MSVLASRWASRTIPEDEVLFVRLALCRYGSATPKATKVAFFHLLSFFVWEESSANHWHGSHFKLEIWDSNQQPPKNWTTRWMNACKALFTDQMKAHRSSQLIEKCFGDWCRTVGESLSVCVLMPLTITLALNFKWCSSLFGFQLLVRQLTFIVPGVINSHISHECFSFHICSPVCTFHWTSIHYCPPPASHSEAAGNQEQIDGLMGGRVNH